MSPMRLMKKDKPRQGAVANTLNVFRNAASLLANAFGVGFIDWLDPLSWLIKVELVLEAGQIRAGLLDNAFREWRILRSGKRSAGRLFCPSIMGVRDNLHVVGMALSVELECTFHRHAMNPFRMLHKLCKHHSTSDVGGLACIRSPDGGRTKIRRGRRGRRDDRGTSRRRALRALTLGPGSRTWALAAASGKRYASARSNRVGGERAAVPDTEPVAVSY
jgi:hypothetical protein